MTQSQYSARRGRRDIRVRARRSARVTLRDIEAAPHLAPGDGVPPLVAHLASPGSQGAPSKARGTERAFRSRGPTSAARPPQRSRRGGHSCTRRIVCASRVQGVSLRPAGCALGQCDAVSVGVP